MVTPRARRHSRCLPMRAPRAPTMSASASECPRSRCLVIARASVRSASKVPRRLRRDAFGTSARRARELEDERPILPASSLPREHRPPSESGRFRFPRRCPPPAPRPLPLLVAPAPQRGWVRQQCEIVGLAVERQVPQRSALQPVNRSAHCIEIAREARAAAPARCRSSTGTCSSRVGCRASAFACNVPVAPESARRPGNRGARTPAHLRRGRRRARR